MLEAFYSYQVSLATLGFIDYFFSFFSAIFLFGNFFKIILKLGVNMQSGLSWHVSAVEVEEITEDSI